MARVTIEDCLIHVPNAFTLARVAAVRARQICRGAPSQLSVDQHKSTVTALQEIARGHIGVSVLSEPDLPVPQVPGLELEPFDVHFK